MSSFLIDYTAYMRHLAERHRSLRHNPDEKHFFRGELQEFWQQFRSEVCFPCLIAESSDNEYSGSQHNPSKRRNTSFIVADRYNQHDDYNEIQLKMSMCEEVAEQIVGRMIRDMENETPGTPFVNLDFDSLQGQYLQNEANRYVGYRISFSCEESVCLYNPSVWQDEED